MNKTLIQLVLLLCVIGIGVLVMDRYVLPCRRPISYAIGDIDPRFHVSADQVKKMAASAEVLWEDASSRDLFVYDSGAKLRINMVFDERQQLTIEGQALDNKHDDLVTFQAGISKEYDALKDEYDRLSSSYDKAVKAYQKDLDQYNKAVDRWNAAGGAPQDTYDRLESERKDLNTTFRDIKSKEGDINGLVNKMNALAAKEEGAVSRYNSQAAEYDEKVGDGRDFDQGIYTGDAIAIYQFKNMSDLRLVLAHEMGHVLGLDHVENPQSVMYYKHGEQDANSIGLSQEDRQALGKRCETSAVDFLWGRVLLLFGKEEV